MSQTWNPCFHLAPAAVRTGSFEPRVTIVIAAFGPEFPEKSRRTAKNRLEPRGGAIGSGMAPNYGLGPENKI